MAAVRTNGPQSIFVITPETQYSGNQSQSRTLTLDDLLGPETPSPPVLANNLKRVKFSKPQNSPIDEEQKFALSVQYRTRLPRISIHEDQAVSKGKLPLYRPNKLPVMAATPVTTSNQKNSYLPAILIARMLTSGGSQSFYPQMYPKFKDVSLIPSPSPRASARDFSDYSFIKMRLRIQDQSHERMGNSVVVENGHNDPNSNSVAIPSIGNTCSVVFPKRNKRISWRRTTTKL